jgi:hypothetical protein
MTADDVKSWAMRTVAAAGSAAFPVVAAWRCTGAGHPIDHALPSICSGVRMRY